jgi:hypothetical protein
MTLWSNPERLELHHWLTNGLAVVMLILILATNLLFRSIPHLGFTVDLRTAIIDSVASESSAAQAGLQVGDRILQLYGRSWNEVLMHPNYLSLVGPPEQPIPITIERAGTNYTFALSQGAPSPAFQVSKITRFVLSMLCWVTGYILGIVRRHEPSGSLVVSWFWLGISGVLGSYFFAIYASKLLVVPIQWLLLSLFIPLVVYVHVWFPVRPVSPQQARTARRMFIGSIVLCNGSLVLLALWQPTLPQLVINLSALLPIAVLGGSLGSWFILRRAYHRTTNAHVRRQVRLIAVAFFSLQQFGCCSMYYQPSFQGCH